MTTKEAILARARRMAVHDGIEGPLVFTIQDDGNVYALPVRNGTERDAVAWWPLPYLGREEEAALADGALLGRLA